MPYSAEFLEKTRKNKARTPFTPDLQQRFLKLYAESGLKGKSAWAVGVHPSAVTHRAKRDPEFAQAVEDARREFMDELESRIDLRSHQSDRILEMFAKRHIPEYREKVQVEGTTTHTHAGEVQVTHRLEVGELSPEQLSALKVLLEAPSEASLPITIDHEPRPEPLPLAAGAPPPPAPTPAAPTPQKKQGAPHLPLSPRGKRVLKPPSARYRKRHPGK